MVDEPDVLVRAERVSKSYVGHGRRLRAQVRVEAVREVDLEIHRGELLALVGESGSGKSTLGRMLVRLTTPSSGQIRFAGAPVGSLSGRALREYRKRVAVVFQNPFRSLNPRMQIGEAIGEPLRVWEIVDRREIPREIARLLESVGLPASYRSRLPHALSGGERQRVAIARALATRPEFLCADEAVSSLDSSAAAEVLNLLMDQRERLGLTTLFVTHDLFTARIIADRVAVMCKGQIVETATPEELFARPRHEYTRTLLDAHISLPADLVEDPPASAEGPG